MNSPLIGSYGKYKSSVTEASTEREEAIGSEGNMLEKVG